jgi:hypothetical protein
VTEQQTKPAEPTGLDYHAAFRAMYPGLASTSVRVHELNDAALKVVSRAAALRRAERERVKQPFLDLADALLRVAQDSDGITAVIYRQNADRIRAAAEEIR